MEATGRVGLRRFSATTVQGNSVQVDARATFSVPTGEGAEVTATLAPPGSPPDRRLYVAVLKKTGGDRYVVVAYGNTTSMFDRALPDAQSLARRIHF